MNAQKIIGLGAWVACFFATSVAAAEDPAPQETMAQKALARDTVCTVCHNESWRVPVLTLYQTRHGNRADPRAPNCQGCQGSSDAHQKDLGGAHPDVVFATKSKNVSSVDDRNTTCLTCHQTDSKRSRGVLDSVTDLRQTTRSARSCAISSADMPSTPERISSV